MKSIIISIHPKHVKNIFEGRKTIELRKNIPHSEMPFRALVYETKKNGGCGKIVGDFICEGFDFYDNNDISMQIGEILKRACIKYHCDLWNYVGCGNLYAWYIKNPIKYDKPEPLSDYGLKRPPQSWQYLKESEVDNIG